MAISKGRNELEASIEDKFAIINSLATDINSYYLERINSIKDDIKRIKENNPNEDFEILQSITNTQKQEIEIYEEFYRVTLEMLLVKVYSYAEKHLEILLSRLLYNRNKAINEYKKDGQPTNNVSDIEKYFYILNKYKNLNIARISDIWIDYNKFHLLRNDIVHHKAHKNSIKIDYIHSNLTQISKLLSIVESKTR